MKVFLSLYTFLIFNSFIVAQPYAPMDSLLRLYLQGDRSVNTLLLLSNGYISKNPDSSLLFSQSAYFKSKVENNSKNLAEASFYIGYALYLKDIQDSAMLYFRNRTVYSNLPKTRSELSKVLKKSEVFITDRQTIQKQPKIL